MHTHTHTHTHTRSEAWLLCGNALYISLSISLLPKRHCRAAAPQCPPSWGHANHRARAVHGGAAIVCLSPVSVLSWCRRRWQMVRVHAAAAVAAAAAAALPLATRDRRSSGTALQRLLGTSRSQLQHGFLHCSVFHTAVQPQALPSSRSRRAHARADGGSRRGRRRRRRGGGASGSTRAFQGEYKCLDANECSNKRRETERQREREKKVQTGWNIERPAAFEEEINK